MHGQSMNMIKCGNCNGAGYVEDPDVLAGEDDMVECKICGASGFVEEQLF